jgi:hypothetical protein
MLAFGRAVAGPHTEVVAPRLGYARTWLRLEPLIDRVEAEVAPALDGRSGTPPVVVVGHSLGGLIWLTLLDRHPEWRDRVRALALLGCPVGGADLSLGFHQLDRAGWTIAHDLSVDRREVARRVATAVPTLAVAGDLLRETDGTITVSSARFEGARFVCLPRESHAGMLQSQWVIRLVRAYLVGPQVAPADPAAVIRHLQPLADPIEAPAPLPSVVVGAAPLPSLLPGRDGPGGVRRRPRWWPPSSSRGAPMAAGDRLPVALLFCDGTTVRLGHRLFGPVLVSVNGPDGARLWAGTVDKRRAGRLSSALQAIAHEQRAALA